MTLEFFLHIFEKNTQTSNFVKIRPVGNPVVPYERTGTQTDGQTDMRKLTVAFRNFEHAPTSGKVKHSKIQSSTRDCDVAAC